MAKRTPHSWAPIAINCTHASLLNIIGLSESEVSVSQTCLSHPQITLPFHLALLRVSPRSCSIRKNAKESAPLLPEQGCFAACFWRARGAGE